MVWAGKVPRQVDLVIRRINRAVRSIASVHEILFDRLYIGEVPSLIGSTTCCHSRKGIGGQENLGGARMWPIIIIPGADFPPIGVGLASNNEGESAINILACYLYIEGETLMINRRPVGARSICLTLRHDLHRYAV